jgi:hypothetical protein
MQQQQHLQVSLCDKVVAVTLQVEVESQCEQQTVVVCAPRMCACLGEEQ